MSTEQTRHVKVVLDPMGYGTAVVDGQDLTRSLVGVEVRSMAGEPTQVALHAKRGQAVEFDGEALVTVVLPGAAGPDIARWLADVDPAAVQRAALARDDLANTPEGVTQAILRVLADLATGKG